MFSPMPALAQAQLTAADIQRLQDSVFDAAADVSRLRQRDARLAEGLERELDDLRDEVIYLKVKMRKSGATRAEYSDLRDRIDQLRSQARGEPAPASSPAPRRPVVDETAQPDGDSCRHRVRCAAAVALNSGTARVEDRFDATTIVPYERNGRVLVPAGSVMRGVVNSVTPASRGINRKGELTLVFDRFSIDGRTYSVRATVMQALQGEADTGRVAAGAGVGAIIGGILGGVRGALDGHSDRRRRHGRGDRRERSRSRAGHRAARQARRAAGRGSVTDAVSRRKAHSIVSIDLPVVVQRLLSSLRARP